MSARLDQWASRDVERMRLEAEEALREYAEMLAFWNAPDAEHSRLQLRAMVEEVIDEHFPKAPA